MKYLILLALFVSACTGKVLTSDSLREKALKACDNVPELDMQRAICAYAYVKNECLLRNYDISICGQLK